MRIETYLGQLHKVGYCTFQTCKCWCPLLDAPQTQWSLSLSLFNWDPYLQHNHHGTVHQQYGQPLIMPLQENCLLVSKDCHPKIVFLENEATTIQLVSNLISISWMFSFNIKNNFSSPKLICAQIQTSYRAQTFVFNPLDQIRCLGRQGHSTPKMWEHTKDMGNSQSVGGMCYWMSFQLLNTPFNRHGQRKCIHLSINCFTMSQNACRWRNG